MSIIKKEISFIDKSSDSELQINQSVCIDIEQNWVYLNNNGDELSMSTNSLVKFLDLICKTIEEADKQKNKLK